MLSAAHVHSLELQKHLSQHLSRPSISCHGITNGFTRTRFDIYTQGLGGTVYLGAGAAVLGYSPQIEMVAIKNEHFDFWIMVRMWSHGCREACRVEKRGGLR